MSILVALELDCTDRTVLDLARRIARGLDCRLWLVHAAEPDPDFVGYAPGPQHVRDNQAGHLHEEHRQIQTLAEELRQSGLDAQGLLIQGPSAEVILAEAEKLDSEMIVIGSHGKGVLRRMMLGSVSGQVLHRSRLPVLVVPVGPCDD